MMIAGGTLGGQSLGSIMPTDSTVGDSWAGQPIVIQRNGTNYRPYIKANTLKIVDTLGQNVSARFTVVNPPDLTDLPVPGDVIRILYFDHVLFYGTIDKIKRSTNNTQTARYFECTCTDFSQVLRRRKIRRNFVEMSVVAILDSVLDNELAEEEITLGTVDVDASISLVDAKNSSVFELLRDLSAATGQSFYVDYDKRIQFRSTTAEDGPLALSTSTVEDASIDTDRDFYINRQTVHVKGTPAEGSDEEPNNASYTDEDEDEIAARAELEGGSGIYEAIDEITHPTSNDGTDLLRLARSYTRVKLELSGALRTLLRARVRAYGFRAGQFVDAGLTSLGVGGEWLIQKVTINEEDGRKLVHQLELSQSTLQQRGFDAWLKIVSEAKITIQLPSGVGTTTQSYLTPGTYSFVVPGTGTVSLELECAGASGGGAGANISDVPGVYTFTSAGRGGKGGKAIKLLDVAAGTTLDIVVGAGGTRGNGCWNSSSQTNGGDGADSYVQIAGVTQCLGGAGTGGLVGGNGDPPGSDGIDGGGTGDIITTGGGAQRSTELRAYSDSSGIFIPPCNAPVVGVDGWVIIRY